MIVSNTRELVPLIDKVCKSLPFRYDEYVRMLMLGTAATESLLRIRVQVGGPARGLWQVEYTTAKSIYEDYLKYRPEVWRSFSRGIGAPGSYTLPSKVEIDDRCMRDDTYCCALARLKYAWDKHSIPNTLVDIAAYYKLVYNTPLGKGSVAKFLRDWRSCKCEELIKEAGPIA
jgi:hypothetical protein